jgi:hypothetical protein
MTTASVTGETRRVSGLVPSVVDRLQRRKSRDADKQDAEQDRGNPVANRIEMGRNAGGRLNQTGHFCPICPPPEGCCGFDRRQVSWLAGRRLLPTFPAST